MANVECNFDFLFIEYVHFSIIKATCYIGYVFNVVGRHFVKTKRTFRKERFDMICINVLMRHCTPAWI